jgi:phosphoribosyl 1,2-cyclic phosphodiesterase
MNLDTLHINLKKAEAILEAATPLDLDALDVTQMRLLIHSAHDYVQAALDALEDKPRHDVRYTRVHLR